MESGGPAVNSYIPLSKPLYMVLSKVLLTGLRGEKTRLGRRKDRGEGAKLLGAISRKAVRREKNPLTVNRAPFAVGSVMIPEVVKCRALSVSGDLFNYANLGLLLLCIILGRFFF